MPLIPRPAVPVIAAGMTAVWVVAASAPSLADQTRRQEWWLDSMGVTQAWHASKGAGVTVAVLSDGVDAAQPDISRSVTVGPDLTNSNETNTTYVGVQGTVITSLIAGQGHAPRGRSGTIGVAPRARVLSIRVSLDARDPAMDAATVGGGLPDAIAAGIRYAVAHHATVIQLPADPGQPNPATIASLPIPQNQTTAPQLAGINAAAGGSTAERAAIAFALRKKVVLVAPAGDNAAGTDAANYPAAYPGVISVGAFDHNFVKASFSSNQPYVTVTAAGQGVMAADNHGGYAVVNSTSAASAMVSGIAALIKSRYPSLSPAQVASVLTSTTMFQRPAGRRHGSGFGTVDAERAMAAAAALTAPAAQRAGAGAQPWASPPTPGAPTVTSQALVPRVLRAGILSAAVLVVLLLVVLGYAAIRRRRQPGKPAPVAEWAPAAQPAYAPYGSADNDRMLEFFATPANSAASPAAGAASAGAAGGAGGGRGVGAWIPLGSGARGHGRQPQVSGRPPWDPAAKPDSELPWAAPGSGRPKARPAGTSAAPAAAAPATPGAPPAVPVRRGAAPADESAARASWPGVAAASATPADQSQPSPGSQPWQELTDRSLAAIRAVSETTVSETTVSETTARRRPAGVTEAKAAAQPAAPAPPAPSSEAPAAPTPAASAPASFPWTSTPGPQSPSGAPWEPADNPDPASNPDATDLHWLPASTVPADTVPADTEQASAKSASGLPRRKPAKPGDALRRSTGSHRKAGRPPAAIKPAATADNEAADGPAAPDTAARATATGAPWETGEPGSRWRTQAQTPTPDSAPPWEQDSGDSAWPAAAEQPAAEALWQPPAADPSADTGQFSWRSSAQTDTFPAVGDDARRDDA